jgi:hypothetical protein
MQSCPIVQVVLPHLKEPSTLTQDCAEITVGLKVVVVTQAQNCPFAHEQAVVAATSAFWIRSVSEKASLERQASTKAVIDVIEIRMVGVCQV